MSLCVVFVCMRLVMSADANRGQKRESDPMELELQEVGSHLPWVLEAEPGLCKSIECPSLRSYLSSPVLRCNDTVRLLQRKARITFPAMHHSDGCPLLNILLSVLLDSRWSGLVFRATADVTNQWSHPLISFTRGLAFIFICLDSILPCSPTPASSLVSSPVLGSQVCTVPPVSVTWLSHILLWIDYSCFLFPYHCGWSYTDS